MKTRILHTKIWEDSYFSELSIMEKLLFLYYLTNKNINLVGIYEITDKKVLFETGVTLDDLRIFQNKVSESQKIFFYKDCVFIVNHNKYQKYDGEKLEVAKNKEIDVLNSDIKDKFNEMSSNKLSKLYGYRIDNSENIKTKLNKTNNKKINQNNGLSNLRNELEKKGVLLKK